jgi:hypothetical protein
MVQGHAGPGVKQMYTPAKKIAAQGSDEDDF